MKSHFVLGCPFSFVTACHDEYLEGVNGLEFATHFIQHKIASQTQNQQPLPDKLIGTGCFRWRLTEGECGFIPPG